MIGIRRVDGLVQLSGPEIEDIRDRIAKSGGAWPFASSEMVGDLRLSIGWPWVSSGSTPGMQAREGVCVTVLRQTSGVVWVLAVNPWKTVEATVDASDGPLGVLSGGLAHFVAQAFAMGARAMVVPVDDPLVARSYMSALDTSRTSGAVRASMEVQVVPDMRHAELELDRLLAHGFFRIPFEVLSEMQAQEQESVVGSRGRDTPTRQAVKVAALAFKEYPARREERRAMETMWPMR